MKPAKNIRCAIYTRVSTDQGLEQEFNSLDAQREASEAYIKSQTHEGWSCLKDQYDDGGFSGGSLERPALQRLIEDVRQKKLDVIVVYKVDRLTRSLADFAKLVELFDTNEVSFVSVTQSFNTTSSMGRLTLNVLLSFAQFEREVTGERIRDKIAASKKKGIWMGGVVPYGYKVESRKLLIDEVEAKEVRLIFELYSQLKSTPALVRGLESRNIKSRIRKLTSGKEVGGIHFTTGQLSHMLGNRVYVGEINHLDQSYPGEHAAVISEELFNSVQETRRLRASNRRDHNEKSGALLAGLLYDDKGNRMSPTHVQKRGLRYQYYQSSVLAQGQRAKAGSVDRVPATEIDHVVAKAILEHFGGNQVEATQNRALVRSHVQQIVVHSSCLKITLRSDSGEQREVLSVQWVKPSATRKREILGVSENASTRPIRGKARSRLLRGIAQGRLWLDQLIAGHFEGITALAASQNVSEKTVRSTLSLAFLAPDIVQAAIDGKLPRGLGVTQMTDLPMDWAVQRHQLGIG
jgi:site-specific DNA recombinase